MNVQTRKHSGTLRAYWVLQKKPCKRLKKVLPNGWLSMLAAILTPTKFFYGVDQEVLPLSPVDKISAKHNTHFPAIFPGLNDMRQKNLVDSYICKTTLEKSRSRICPFILRTFIFKEITGFEPSYMIYQMILKITFLYHI